MYQVSKHITAGPMRPRRYDIGPFRSFVESRRECQEWIDGDAEQKRLGAECYRRAPKGAGRTHAVEMADAIYWIEKVTP